MTAHSPGLNKGATFSFDLAAVVSLVEAREPWDVSRARPLPTTAGTVLVVEDQADNRELLTMMA